jgi:hypothetical protein
MSALRQERTLRPLARPPKVADDTSFDVRFTAPWTGATNVLGPLVIQSTECSYAGVVLSYLVTRGSI